MKNLTVVEITTVCSWCREKLELKYNLRKEGGKKNDRFYRH
jgi:hypothetical protein